MNLSGKKFFEHIVRPVQPLCCEWSVEWRFQWIKNSPQVSGKSAVVVVVIISNSNKTGQ